MRKTKNQGFSLVELLLAMAILGIIMVAIASFMSSTTATYVKSRNDVKVQQDGQEVFDAIADKVMQAKLIRVGTTSDEYAAVGDFGSVGAEATDGYLLHDSTDNAIAATLHTGNVYSYDALTDDVITTTNPLEYVAMVYDAPVDDGGNQVYGYAADVFFFVDNRIYMFHYKMGARESSLEGSGSDSDLTKEQLGTFLTNCVESVDGYRSDMENNDESLNKEHLLCDTFGIDSSSEADADVYASTKDNALFMKFFFTEGKIENSAEGVVTIRNSYVLEPKDRAATSSEDSSEESSSEESSSEESSTENDED